MSTPLEELKQTQTQEIFVRADEVDAGTTILSAGGQKPLSALSPADGINSGTTRPKPPPRPVLRRETSAPPPPPPSIPPPAPPANATDSLSLPQLKQLVNQFPKTEQRAYAYQYRDAEDYPTEVDEWFCYTELDQDRDYLLTAREAFEDQWKGFCKSELKQDDASWTEIDHKHRQNFVSRVASGLKAQSVDIRRKALATIYYVLTGVWSVNAGLAPSDDGDNDDDQDRPEHHNMIQIRWMHRGADLVADHDTVGWIYECLRKTLDGPVDETRLDIDVQPEDTPDYLQDQEVALSISCLYLLAESARVRSTSTEGRHIRQLLMSAQPNMLIYLVRTISRLRWDEAYQIPQVHALQLLWKLILVFFGDSKTDLENVKGILQPRIDPFSSEAAHPILTASPLDYHMFRQEITSKYPAYNPPLPLIPLEIEQKTMLPPPMQASKIESFDQISHQGSVNTSGGSILHQPVHIATPAPSPPPSPAVGGKGKKQNYQTNQNFPFLYPPLDSTSNNIGGSGTTEFQDLMVGKKWEGSDIPASIIEAGELFASRMRMTRAMRQLWRERDLFMKYERGWDGSKKKKHPKNAGSDSSVQSFDSDREEKLKDEDLQRRMDAVEEFFHLALPDLQSLIIVMMKRMLLNVQDIAIRNGGIQEGQTNGLSRTKSNPNMAQSQSLPLPPPPPRPNEMTLDELDNIRSGEISQKAISGSIFLLLKWFKASHVLKFEYMTQLLLDSNYIQLTLKYFAHQNLEDLVAFKYDRDDFSFWHYCHLHSDHPPLSPTSPDSHPHSDTSSIDEAIPPPIQRHRRSPTTTSEGTTSLPSTTISAGTPLSLVQSPEQTGIQRQVSHPSVDELGNPLAPLPNTPITTFSPRQFQTSIHLLRVLQKLTRSKSHRILLLVQFKSSQILRRVLRVPDPFLRLYVLKLFKSQVPYCGRKWRQSNMRVITAIYLHCRPELRDEWLAGMHDTNVEGEVDEAVPLEWALRGLTFWWMKRTYPDVMRQKKIQKRDASHRHRSLNTGDATTDKPDTEAEAEAALDSDSDLEGGQEVDDDERDFFQRELDAMGWGIPAFGTSEDVAFGEEAPGVGGGGNMVAAHPVSAIANGINGEHHIGWESNLPNMSHNAGQGGGPGAGGMEMW